MADPLSISARVSGLLRGSELAGDATLVLLPPHLEVHTGRRLIVLRLSSLDGLETRGELGFLHLSWGDVLELRARDGLEEFAAAITAAALTLPELTTSLRSYGSPRAGAGAEQEAFFAPLRAALSRARAVRGQSETTAAFSSQRLAADLETQLSRMAALRFPVHPPERRALEAELIDCAAAVSRRIEALSGAEQRLEQAAESSRFAAWREWSDALTDVFGAHDACWPLVRAALAAATHSVEETKRPTRRWGRTRRPEGQ